MKPNGRWNARQNIGGYFQQQEHPMNPGALFYGLFQFKAHADTFRLEPPCDLFDALSVR